MSDKSVRVILGKSNCFARVTSHDARKLVDSEAAEVFCESPFVLQLHESAVGQFKLTFWGARSDGVFTMMGGALRGR
jgi:hypothetical protein